MLACTECGRFFACERMGVWVVTYRTDSTGKAEYEAIYRADRYGCRCFTVLTEFGRPYCVSGNSDFTSLVAKILGNEAGEFYKIKHGVY